MSSQSTRRMAAAALFAALATFARADVPPRVITRPASQLWLEGDSTLHGYKSTATRLEIAAPIASDFRKEDGRVMEALARSVNGLTLTIPVAGLKSGKDGLDKNLMKALKAREHPEITFRMTGRRGQTALDGDAIRVAACGELAIAGKTNTIDMDVDARATTDGIVVEGSKELLMTDFGVDPPKFMLGTVKASNKVVVHFRLVLGLENQ